MEGGSGVMVDGAVSRERLTRYMPEGRSRWPTTVALDGCIISTVVGVKVQV